MSCGIGSSCGLDLTLLWLWCRLAATPLIQPLALELPYAMHVTLKKAKKKYIYYTYFNIYNFKIYIISINAASLVLEIYSKN